MTQERSGNHGRRSSRSGTSVGVMAGAALALAVVVPAAASPTAKVATASKTSPVPIINAHTSMTMTEWNWDTAADSPDSAAILPAVIKGFEKKYPHIKVANTSMSLGEQTDKLPLAFATAKVNKGIFAADRVQWSKVTGIA